MSTVKHIRHESLHDLCVPVDITFSSGEFAKSHAVLFLGLPEADEPRARRFSSKKIRRT